MTGKEFMDKWAEKAGNCHPDYRRDPDILFWVLSYDVDAPYISDLVADFLSIPGVADGDGMAYGRALQLAK